MSGGKANTAAGIRKARQLFSGDRHKTLVLITNRPPNVEAEKLPIEVELAKKEGATLMVCAIGNEDMQTKLGFVASGERQFNLVDRFSKLGELKTRVVDNIVAKPTEE